MKVNSTNDNSRAGLTLPQLRYQRAMALVKLEMSKEQLASTVFRAKQRASSEGLRGLFMSNIALKRMKIADYAFLGFKLSQLVFKLWKRRGK